MNKMEKRHPKRAKAIRDLVERVQGLLLLDDVNLVIRFEEVDDCKADRKLHESERYKADCEADSEYQRAILRFNIDILKPDKYKSAVVHEIIHYLTHPLERVAHRLEEYDDMWEEEVRYAREVVVTNLEKLFIFLFDQLGALDGSD